MTATDAEAVAAGAALLDEKNPGWWRPDIPHPVDLDALIMSSCASCVLGQLYRYLSCYDGYGMGLRQLGLNRYHDPGSAGLNPRAFGFTIENRPDEDRDEFDDIAFGTLRQEWVRVITGRRAAVTP